jgi:hypothetical protein
MTAVAVPAGIVPPGPAWRSLLWLMPLTVLWVVLIYWQPFIPASGVPTSAHQLMAHGVIAVGLWLGLESTDLTPSQRRTTWLAVMIPDTLWFAVAWNAAINGIFITGASPLPLLPLAIFLPVIIGAPLLLLSKRVGQGLETFLELLIRLGETDLRRRTIRLVERGGASLKKLSRSRVKRMQRWREVFSPYLARRLTDGLARLPVD